MQMAYTKKKERKEKDKKKRQIESVMYLSQAIVQFFLARFPLPNAMCVFASIVDKSTFTVVFSTVFAAGYTFEVQIRYVFLRLILPQDVDFCCNLLYNRQRNKLFTLLLARSTLILPAGRFMLCNRVLNLFLIFK